MLPEILLFDLDFTLLRTDKTISERTLSALKKAVSAGSRIGFSTSRGNTNIRNYIKLVNPDFVISNGGACIYEKGRLIHKESFNIEETHSILAETYRILGENAEITIDVEDTLYWNRKENRSQLFDPYALFDDMKDFSKPALKICIQTTDADAVRKIASSVPCCDCFPFSDIPWYKFSSAKATKENAIDFLSEYTGVPLEKTAAFGDDFGDIGMLKKCGTGVAMANAIPEVKAAANEVTASCDEDGIALWIEKHL